MNFIRNRNFRAGPQTSLEGFICPQNSDKQQKIKVFGRSEGGGKGGRGKEDEERETRKREDEKKGGKPHHKVRLPYL